MSNRILILGINSLPSVQEKDRIHLICGAIICILLLTCCSEIISPGFWPSSYRLKHRPCIPDSKTSLKSAFICTWLCSRRLAMHKKVLELFEKYPIVLPNIQSPISNSKCPIEHFIPNWALVC